MDDKNNKKAETNKEICKMERISFDERKRLLRDAGNDVDVNLIVKNLLNTKALKVMKERCNEDSTVLDATAVAMGYGYYEPAPLDLLRETVENLTFREFICHFEKMLNRIQEDEEFGRDNIERLGAPMLVLFQPLLKKYPPNPELIKFFNLEYKSVLDYISKNSKENNLLPTDYSKEYFCVRNLTVRNVIASYYDKCKEGWVPPESIEKYVEKIKSNISNLYTFGYLVLLSLSRLET